MNDDIWREVMAEFEFPPHESQHPIEWTSLWRPHAVGDVAADGETFAGKLHRSLGYGYGCTFFRKISTDVNFREQSPHRRLGAPRPTPGRVQAACHWGLSCRSACTWVGRGRGGV